MGYEWVGVALDALRGIEPFEVTQALGARRRWPRPARDDVTGVSVLTIWGRTDRGRPLLVAVRHVQGLDWQIVGARDLGEAEISELEKWEATDDE
jgi:hypothetical protein